MLMEASIMGSLLAEAESTDFPLDLEWLLFNLACE